MIRHLRRWSLQTLPFHPGRIQIRSHSVSGKTVSDRQRDPEPGGCRYDLCLYRLRARGRIYLPSRGTGGTRVRGKSAGECGSIPRQKKRFFEESVKPKICRSMITSAASAYLRAKEDYLMGINFSRLLTLKYGNSISNFLQTKYSGDFRRPGHDLCAWHGGAQRTGDP